MPRSLLVAAIVAVASRSLAADCPTTDPEVVAARAAVETSCPCATATSAGARRECARGVLRGLVGDGALAPECVRAVRRCVQRSICGRPDAVTCCGVRENGTVRCRIKRAASKCPTGRPGYCVGAVPSCCDACDATGCAPTTTTTLPECGGGPGSCGGRCPSGLTCAFVQDAFPFCGCVPDGSQPCGSATVPFCNGTCPLGERCGAEGIVPGLPCSCIPEAATACGESSTSTCTATCADGVDGTRVCAPFVVSSTDLCICVDADGECTPGAPPTLGLCPPGERCEVTSGQCMP